jgi:ferric-dicitrate binding protein FerR (iron transport regulator)
VEDAVSDDDDKIDLEAWEPQVPPSDFAERVLTQVRAEEKSAAPIATSSIASKSKARRWGAAGGVAGILALAAALAVRVTGLPETHGEVIAKDRIEVSIGSRARAVLESGAQVKWDGDDVVQAHGDVFYRVEPGARFRVHTPAGDVEVKGTCFAVKVRGEGQGSKVEGVDMEKRDVKSGVIGAALSALAFVAVYEGKVAVSHAGERVDLGAGEGAQVGNDGVTKSAALGEGQKTFDAKVAANAAGDAPLAAANENLVAQVSEYRARLEAIAAQKLELEQTLKNTEQKLASKSDGSAPKTRSDFDLGADDWKELAKDGTIKYMMPCKRPGGWVASPDQLQKLALAPHDGPALQAAYAKSNERLWSTIKPLCGQAIGSVDVAEKVGMSTCIHLVLDLAQAKEKDAANEAMRQVAEIRAGMRPMPAANDGMSPVTKMFLVLTGEMKSFEGDLAQSLGPDEAHRVAYAEGMCMGQSTFGGPGPRDGDKK